MPAPLLIVGQGVAGTLLAWECERAGIEFEIADAGHAGAASRVGAGIINPITGQRIVKSWRVDELIGPAEATYRKLEDALGVAVLRRMRVRRHFRSAEERSVFAAKARRGELAPFVRSEDAGGTTTGAEAGEGFWVEPAFHVDLPALIAAARRRWRTQGRLTERTVVLAEERARRDVVVLCTGAAAGSLGGVTFDRVKGEALRVVPERPCAEPDVIHNDGHWLLPLADGDAMVGASYDRTATTLEPSAPTRALLETSATRLLGGGGFKVREALAGWRVSVRDLRPATGRVAGDPQVGFINGLGSKGALYAPWLARQWINHLTERVPFDPGVDAARLR